MQQSLSNLKFEISNLKFEIRDAFLRLSSSARAEVKKGSPSRPMPFGLPFLTFNF